MILSMLHVKTLTDTVYSNISIESYIYKNLKTSRDFLLQAEIVHVSVHISSPFNRAELTPGLKMLQVIRPLIGTGNECFIEKIAMVTTECFNEKTSELGVIVGGVLDL